MLLNPTSSSSSFSSGQTELISSQQRGADKSSDLAFLHFFSPKMFNSGKMHSFYNFLFDPCLIYICPCPRELVGFPDVISVCGDFNFQIFAPVMQNQVLCQPECDEYLCKIVLRMSNVLRCEQISSSPSI